MQKYQTHALPSIYRQVKCFMPFYDIFHFTTFALLTPFAMDNLHKWKDGPKKLSIL
jgi:hypothetical protein